MDLCLWVFWSDSLAFTVGQICFCLSINTHTHPLILFLSSLSLTVGKSQISTALLVIEPSVSR